MRMHTGRVLHVPFLFVHIAPLDVDPLDVGFQGLHTSPRTNTSMGRSLCACTPAHWSRVWHAVVFGVFALTESTILAYSCTLIHTHIFIVTYTTHMHLVKSYTHNRVGGFLIQAEIHLSR